MHSSQDIAKHANFYIEKLMFHIGLWFPFLFLEWKQAGQLCGLH